MYRYEIEMIFAGCDGLPKIEDCSLETLLENARATFNDTYLKNHKDNRRKIDSIVLKEKSICIYLNSDIKLDHPPKALIKFSKALVDTGMLNNYTYNNRLLRSISVIDLSEELNLTDSELLNTLINWIVDSSQCTPTLKEKRRQAIENIKQIVQSINTI